MTWDEGLSYVAAERTERKMREEALSTPRITHPPRLPLPYDARMTDSSRAFEDVVAEAAEDGISAKVQQQSNHGTAARGLIDDKVEVPPSKHSMTFREWFDAQNHFDLHSMSTPEERRLLRRRMERDDCKWRQSVSEDPATSVLVGVVLASFVGIALGSSIVAASSRRASYRGETQVKRANPPPPRPPSAEKHNPFFRKATAVQKNTVEKLMTFLG